MAHPVDDRDTVPVTQTLANRYPRFTAYVAQLPAGLASYPDCTSRASLTLMQLKGMPEPHPDPAHVPALVGRYLRDPPTRMWIPEVEARAISLFIADHYAMTPQQFHTWSKGLNRSFFGSLMYRAVFSFLSPASLGPRAPARWAAVHRGSTMRIDFHSATSADISLDFPPRLFNKAVLEQMTAVFEAAIENSNAKWSEAVLAVVTDTQAIYDVKWG